MLELARVSELAVNEAAGENRNGIVCNTALDMLVPFKLHAPNMIAEEVPRLTYPVF